MQPREYLPSLCFGNAFWSLFFSSLLPSYCSFISALTGGSIFLSRIVLFLFLTAKPLDLAMGVSAARILTHLEFSTDQHKPGCCYRVIYLSALLPIHKVQICYKGKPPPPLKNKTIIIGKKGVNNNLLRKINKPNQNVFLLFSF